MPYMAIHYATSLVVEAPDSTNSYTFDSAGFGTTKVAPNWMRWVETTQVDSDGAINIDVDGEYPKDSAPSAVIDLSAAMSHIMGRQIAQNQTFRVKYIQVSLQNHDDTVDNSESAVFSGRVRWYSPTHHRVEAYQAFRKMWKAYYQSTTAANLFIDPDHYATQGEYKGLRVGLVETAAGGIQQVPFQSRDPFTDIDGIYPNLHYIFDAYDEVTIPSVDKKPENALWTSGRTGYPEGIEFQTYLKNMGSNQLAAQAEPYQIACDADVMCGLMAVTFTGSSAQGDLADTIFTDEYRVVITIGVEGWGGDF